jgi:hypothetical protein
MDTFRALAPPQGMKFTSLFTEAIDDNDARFKRLEDAVQALRNDFDTVVPSMVRLVAIEKDMKELVGQLQTLTEQPVEDVPPLPQDAVAPPPLPVEPAAAPARSTQTEQPVTAPAPSAKAAQVTAPPSQQNSGEDVVQSTEAAPKPTPARSDVLATPSSSVTPGAAPKGMPPEGAAPLSIPAPPVSLTPVAPKNEPAPAAPKPSAAPVSKGKVSAIRIGDHKDKTRIVIDMTGKPEMKATLSPNGKQVIIDMAGWDWTLAKEWLADNSQLVAAWEYKEGKLLIDVIYKSTIKTQQVLQPNGTPGYRLVIDLFCPDVHQ